MRKPRPVTAGTAVTPLAAVSSPRDAILAVTAAAADGRPGYGRMVREHAVYLVNEAGMSIRKAALEVAVPVGTVKDWVYEDRRLRATGARLTEREREELERLRRENALLHARIDALQKALAEATGNGEAVDEPGPQLRRGTR